MPIEPEQVPITRTLEQRDYPNDLQIGVTYCLFLYGEWSCGEPSRCLHNHSFGPQNGYQGSNL
jgi:hypothetical protein